MPTLEELIEQSTKHEMVSRCWARALEGEAAEYISALDEIETQKKGTVNRQEVARVLAEVFGVVITVSPVENHFGRKCRCGR